MDNLDKTISIFDISPDSKESGPKDMKRIICFLLLLCTAFSLMGCGGNGTPVPYSDDLKRGTKCYIDVIEINPYGADSVDILCKCVLSDGRTAVLSIYSMNYLEYFEPEIYAEMNAKGDYYLTEDVLFMAKHTTYDTPVHIVGKIVLQAKNALYPGNAVSFIYADEGSLSDSSSKMQTGIEFKNDLPLQTLVYADIIDIKPEYGSSYFGGVTFDHVICNCATASGDTVWMNISVDDYHDYFDASASFSYDILKGSNKTDIEFVAPIRVCGLTAEPKSITGMASSDSPFGNCVLEFRDADKEAVQNALLWNQHPVMYTGKEKEKQQVYADIIAITPAYILSYGSMPTSLICSCRTSSGGSVWINVSFGLYKQYFFEDYAESLGVERVTDNTVHIVGRVSLSDKLGFNVKDSIGSDTVIALSEISVE